MGVGRSRDGWLDAPDPNAVREIVLHYVLLDALQVSDVWRNHARSDRVGLCGLLMQSDLY